MPTEVRVISSSRSSFDPDDETINNVSSNTPSREDSNDSSDYHSRRAITDEEIETLSHFKYDEEQDQLIGDRAIETTLNSLFLGEQHKMSSGAENIFFTNLSTNTNYYSMKGGLKDQSITANQGGSGFIPPTGRVYSDMFSLPLGGSVNSASSIGYSGGNYFGINIAGLGITTIAAEQVDVDVSLEYTLQVNGKKVYKQILNREAALTRSDKTIYPNDMIEWFFDHPVEILAGTTIYAEIRKVNRVTDEDFGVFQVREGDALQSDGNYRYQTIVHNRLFEDKDLELISPYLKYKAMDFGLDATGSTILLRDLSLSPDNVLVPHAVNTLEAIANGTEIQIKIKDGAKVLVESLPVNAASVNGSFVNSVLNQAVVQLNEVFTNTSGFISPDTFVSSFTLSGSDLTLGLNDGVSYTVDVTSLGVDENNFVASGSLSGSNLILTMDDATTVTIDASSLAVDENTTITFGTLANNLLTLNASDSSTITIDVSALNVDTNLYVESGVLNGTNIILTMSDASTVTVDALGLSVDENTTIYSGLVSGTDIILSLSDASVITIDASTLGGTGSSNEVVSGSVIGDNLVLVMSDASEITIDASNMINGSSLTAVNDDWYYSYGTYANQEVTVPYNNGAIAPNNAPFYFGTELSRGSEFKWNMRNLSNFDIGIWDGAEVATSYGFAVDDANWLTAFNFNGGFQDGTNTDLKNVLNSGSKYSVPHDTPVSIRFGTDGHLTLIDLTGGNEVVISKTQTPLTVQSFNMQLGLWQNNEFPNAVVANSQNLWEIKHDFDSSEAGVFNGIEDHTVIASTITVNAGEKFMFDLDRLGSGEFFGTNYTGAISGNASAESQLVNSFEYKTNEAVTLGGNWTANTAAANYFLAGGGLHSWRVGGSNNRQDMFSIRHYFDNSIQLWSETENELIATSLLASDGNPIGFFMGSDEAMTYNEIPTVSKQSITQGNQPNANYVPVVANQTASVEESGVLNYQVISSDNIVNQFVEVDAPSWMTMNQNSGVLSGTAPTFLGTSADTIVVNCKAGNAVGGTVDFTVTITVSEDASYSNTKSLQFNGTSTYLSGNPTLMSAMDRATNGDGNAWSLSIWFKPSTGTSTQTLFNYGNGSGVNEGAITLHQTGGNNLTLQYGTTSNKVVIAVLSCLTVSAWNHLVVTFDGGTTGVNQADLSNYYSRFSIAVDGVVQTQYGSHSNYGYTGVLNGNDTSNNIFRIGRDSNVYNNYFDGVINQVAIWNSDQSANLSAIYNGGLTQDMSLLSAAPSHLYDIETSVTTITDSIGNTNLTGYNFVSGNLVTDVPS